MLRPLHGNAPREGRLAQQVMNPLCISREVLRYSAIEHPVVCQLGGNDPEKLAAAAKLCEQMGYDEVNLNVGCPSERVQDGAFGACLMKDADLVAHIMKTLKNSVLLLLLLKG
jgi:tRNA-dihydrouridine synthase A